MRCVSPGPTLATQSCCNYFDMTGSCVEACPANSSHNAQFECECDPGYMTVGNTCVEINECLSDPCQNGGTCQNTLGSYTCTCGEVWQGPNCEVCGRENCLQCVGAEARCVNCSSGYISSLNGTCSELKFKTNNYQDQAFLSSLVKDPDLCDPECQFGGTCQEGHCLCSSEFIGEDCSGTTESGDCH